MLDNLKNKSSDMMNDPAIRAKIEQMARDHGITLDEAKNRYMKQLGM